VRIGLAVEVFQFRIGWGLTFLCVGALKIILQYDLGVNEI